MTFPIHNRSFSSKNSLEVFETVFNESKNIGKNNLGLRKFEKRIEPKDEMSYLQIDQNNLNFIAHVLKRSYLKHDDTPFLYTTRKGIMVYTSLRTELKKKQQEIPRLVYNIKSATLNSAIYGVNELEQELKKEKTNEGECLYFYNWYYGNLGGTFNKTNSYGRKFSYYDLTNGTTNEISTDEHELSTHSLKAKDNIGKITNNDEYGIFDKNNMHVNYMLSRTQNKYLKENFFGTYLVVYTRPSKDLNLFDRVNVEIKSLLPIESTQDDVHSGQYIVGGIIHQASKDGIYNCMLVLYRNGLNVKGLLKDFESTHSSKPISTATITKPKTL
jgi:hypothetical protein